MSYMAYPTRVLKQFLEATEEGTSLKGSSFQYGQLSMALEIITVIRTLEALPITTEVGRQETITALHTLLQSVGIADVAYEMYDYLSRWRRPRIVAESPLRVPSAIASADVPAAEHHLASHLGVLRASLDGARLGEPSPEGSSDALPQGDRSPGESTTSESAESLDEEG